jgi:pyruvate dehydrogenase E2 component (dihydrolipoamide acetyltransferase)/2-oxoisovalerate dehydrogenase E2 component (dihydrolipoyl transacylase)
MDFALPELGEGVYEAELVAWLVKVGDRVKRAQNLMEVMTDKATMEVPSRFVGTITALNAAPGQQLKVGQVVLTYMPRDEDRPAEPVPATAAMGQQGNGPPAPAAASVGVAPSPLLRTPSVVKAAPSVRQMARKLGIDLGVVRGSGPEGRILIGDVTSLIQTRKTAEKTAPPEPRPDYGTPGTRIKLVGLRRKVAEHMALAKRTVAHYSYVDECDVTELVRIREALRDKYAKAGLKLTYLAFAVKAVTAALREVPIVNASLDEKAEEIVLHDRYHIGIAVATPGGLIVPVVHDADRKDLGQIAREIERLSAEARAGKARMEDLRGGTFTITSIGNIGGLFSTPVVNYPEVGILGLGKIVRRPVYDAAGNIRPADLLYLSFSFDHRVVDGAVGAAFGNAVNRQLQNPLPLLLPEKFA